MHVILFFGPRRLHLSLFCYTLCLLNIFKSILCDARQLFYTVHNAPSFGRIQYTLTRISPREPLVVATQPELSNEPAHCLKSMRDDRAPSFRSWALHSVTSLVVSVRQCVAGPVTARGVPSTERHHPCQWSRRTLGIRSAEEIS